MATIAGGLVAFIPQTSSENGVVAQNLLDGVHTVTGGVQINGNTLTPSSTLFTSGRVVIGVGGSDPTNVGPINLGTLQPNVVSVLINNTSATTLATSPNGARDTIVAGLGGLFAEDNGFYNIFDVGGGTNAVTLNGIGARFSGDGTNTITLNNSNSGIASTVTGTSASSDTIVGTPGATGNLVYVDGGGTAWINPTAGDVTIIGGTGAETVFGGAAQLQSGIATAQAFTGSLTVLDGTGYFAGGSKGNNIITSSTAGGSTLVGGGNGDVLTSKGAYDRMAAGTGIDTLDASQSPGGVAFFGNTNGGTIMYGSTSLEDDFFIANSTVGRPGFYGAFVSLHTAPGAPIYNLNTNVGNAIDLGYLEGGLGVSHTSVYDFITGVDWVNVFNGGASVSATLAFHDTSKFFTLTTSTGTVVDFFNNTTMTAADIRGDRTVVDVTRVTDHM